MPSDPGSSSSSPSAGVPFVVTLQSAGQSGSQSGSQSGAQSPQAAQYPTKLGGFSYNPAESIPYTLNSDGTLSTPNGIYSVLPGTSSEPFVPGTPAPGAITGTWSISPDGTLSWVNPAFKAPGNAAAFYEDPSGSATSGIIAVFDGSVPPAPYVPVELRTNPGRSRYSRKSFSSLTAISIQLWHRRNRGSWDWTIVFCRDICRLPICSSSFSHSWGPRSQRWRRAYNYHLSSSWRNRLWLRYRRRFRLWLRFWFRLGLWLRFRFRLRSRLWCFPIRLRLGLCLS